MASGGGISFQRSAEIPYGQALLACCAKAASVVVSAATADSLEEKDDDAIWDAIARHGYQSTPPVMVMLPSFGGDRSVHPIPPSLSGLAAAAAERATTFYPYSDEPVEDGEERYVSDDWLDHIRNTQTRYQRFLHERAPKIRWLDQLATTLIADLAATAVVNHETPQRTGLVAQRRGPGGWGLVVNERGGRVANIAFARRAAVSVPLVMVANESDRAGAIEALAAAGLENPFDPTPGWLKASVEPGLHGWLNVIWRGRLAGHPIAAELARLRLEDNQLTVFAPPLRTPIEMLMRRVGYPATQIRIDVHPGDPYQLFGNDLVSWIEGPENAQRTPRRLRQQAREQLPAQWADVIQDAWIPPVIPVNPPLPEGMFTPGGERIAISLTAPEEGLTPQSLCRLCDQPSHDYCEACGKDATQGLFGDEGFDEPWNDAAIWALQTLADIEFGGPPAIAQLAELPSPGAQSDLLMLCRMLIPRSTYSAMGADRKSHSWTDWLARAGLLVDGVRRSRGITVMAKDGHICRSLLERQIDDFLYDHGIDHDPEPNYPFDPERNTTGYRADWKLPDGTYVEALGFPENSAYMAKVDHKLQLAQRFHIPTLTITHADLGRLDEIFTPWLPAEIPTRAALPPRPAPPTAPAKDSNAADGSNAANTKAQSERLNRCRRAVELQSQGVTRKGIAEQLSVSPEVVKSLLRDGKFYANPASDPERNTRAAAAAAAKARATTRDEFQRDARLSLGKIKEAWRDAAILYDPQTFAGPPEPAFSG